MNSAPLLIGHAHPYTIFRRRVGRPLWFLPCPLGKWMWGGQGHTPLLPQRSMGEIAVAFPPSFWIWYEDKHGHASTLCHEERGQSPWLPSLLPSRRGMGGVHDHTPLDHIVMASSLFLFGKGGSHLHSTLLRKREAEAMVSFPPSRRGKKVTMTTLSSDSRGHLRRQLQDHALPEQGPGSTQLLQRPR